MSSSTKTINNRQYKMIDMPDLNPKIKKAQDYEPKKYESKPFIKKPYQQKSLLVESEEEDASEEPKQKVTKIDKPIVYQTADEIKEKLKLYTRIMSDELADLPMGCRVAYITVYDKDKFLYRTGGVLIKNGAPEYMVLTNNQKSWSVQLENTIVFRENYQMMVDQYEQTIKDLKKQLKQAHASIARFNEDKNKEKSKPKKKKVKDSS